MMKKCTLLIMGALSLVLSVNAQISITKGNNLVSTGLAGCGSDIIDVSHSIFLGEAAGNAASTANSSIFIGNMAGNSVVNAPYTILVGPSAGELASDIRSSVFIGETAGNNTNTISWSNFIGPSAGMSSYASSNSNFLGHDVGFSADFCDNSNFLGTSSGSAARYASNSNFLGNTAGCRSHNGSYSNFLGYAAGRETTNASYSLLLGYNVGNENGSSSHIGSNNIVIGTNISLPNATTNSMNIGGVLFGTGFYANTTDSPSIAACSTGKIGIGVITPVATLDVAGNANISAGINIGDNVGIGTKNPQAKLDVIGDIRYSGNLLFGNWQLSSSSWPGSGGFAYNGGDMIFGIHSTSGQASLQINGAFIQAESGKVNTYAGASQFNNTVNFPGTGIWNTSGSVGIGTTTPDYTLTVNGKFKTINDNNEFSYNGAADIILKYAGRGTGGRALVHADGNILNLNFGDDFTGGTRIGNDVYFKDNGNSYIYSGNFGIGTTTPDQKLTVKGKIHAEEVIVDLNVPVADYVFAKDYDLMPLHKVEQYVQQNSHLPDIPSASEIKEQGLSMGEMQNKLLKKIEELTLYAIEQQKEIQTLKSEIKQLKR